MVVNKFDKLTEKYLAGASSLQEEQSLFDNSEKSGSAMELWSAFVKGNKRESPENFNEKLWISFKNRKKKQRKLRIGIMSAAASVMLIIGFLIGNPGHEKLSYSEKEALLNQAINMFNDSEQEITEEEIIYEDELIIIYTKAEL